MEQKQKILFHQIHPAKLATDAIFAAMSLYLFWQHQFVFAVITHIVPPVAASWLLIRYADLEPYRNSAFGRYVERYMTRGFDYLRLGGDVIMVFGAWFHRPQLIGIGLVLILAAWGNGLLRPKHIRLKR